jgi:hypothetical protein
MSKPEHSWRDFQGAHAAAEFYHGFSTAEQLQELADDIEKQKVIFEPIHTATVFGKSYVIDGISRLDAIEKTGRQIIDEKGNWIGMLADKIVHHPGKTDEEVWDIVHSLNDQRRHLTESQRAIVAAKRVELREQAASEKSYCPKEKKLPRPAHRPSKGLTQAEEEEADKMNVGVTSVRRARKVLKQAPEKVPAIMGGKETVGKAASELEEEKAAPSKPRKKEKAQPTFEQIVAHALNLVLRRFGKTEGEQLPARRILVKELLGISEVAPVSVKYPDGDEFAIDEVLENRARLKSDKGKSPKVKKSHDITAAVTGAPSSSAPKKAAPKQKKSRKGEVSEAVIQEAKDKIASGKAKVDGKGNLIDKATGKIICQVVREDADGMTTISEAKTGEWLYGAIHFR